MFDRDFPEWASFGENTVRRLRNHDNAIERLVGEVMKTSTELGIVTAFAVVVLVPFGAAHPDIEVTYRIHRRSVITLIAPTVVFLGGYMRCWFAD